MVYLMQCGDLVKIGKTRTSLEQRATAITNQLKMPALPFFALETPCCSGVECHLHHKFCDRRISGEFFRLDDFDIAYVKSLAYWNDLPIRAYDVARDAYFWPSPKWRKPLQLSPGAPTVPDMAIQLQERFRAIIEAAQLLKDGPTVAELRDRAGHANISTTSLYAHVSGEKATATRLKIQ
jgi:hypothetical protein